MSENTFIIGAATTIEEVRNAVAAGAKIDRLTKFHLGYADAFKLPGNMLFRKIALDAKRRGQ